MKSYTSWNILLFMAMSIRTFLGKDFWKPHCDTLSAIPCYKFKSHTPSWTSSKSG